MTKTEKELYKRALEEMKEFGLTELGWKEIIALQQSKLEKYRREIGELIAGMPKEISEPIRECAGLIDAGVVVTDGIVRVNKDDVLILKTPTHRRNHWKDLKEELEERTGMKVILLDTAEELIGVAERGRC